MRARTDPVAMFSRSSGCPGTPWAGLRPDFHLAASILGLVRLFRERLSPERAPEDA